jgi:putative GTP pyrophosphokinase
MDTDEIRAEFDRHYPVAQKFAAKVLQEIEAILAIQHLSLAVPLESRVKSLASITEKLQRKPQNIKSIVDISDFVGVRAILLFSRDADDLGAAIENHFTVLEKEDTGIRLGEKEFGYQSRHYRVSLPREWLTVPSLAPFRELCAELQVRTAAQHIWAATSHILQYKQEQSVPLPLRRSIYRVSALLETVDLEFERLLGERRQYVEQTAEPSTEQPLDVDVLANILNRSLPEKNKEEVEDYSELLSELIAAGFHTTADVAALIARRLPEAMAREQAVMRAFKREQPDSTGRIYAVVYGDRYGGHISRMDAGVFFSHTGLVREMLGRKAKSKSKQARSKTRPGRKRDIE